MKSLRALAKELGVSASYLSQVNHGKKKASAKLLTLLTSVSQNQGNVNQKTKLNRTASRASNPYGGHSVSPVCSTHICSRQLVECR
jgi:hypothetical protein